MRLNCKRWERSSLSSSSPFQIHFRKSALLSLFFSCAKNIDKHRAHTRTDKKLGEIEILAQKKESNKRWKWKLFHLGEIESEACEYFHFLSHAKLCFSLHCFGKWKCFGSFFSRNTHDESRILTAIHHKNNFIFRWCTNGTDKKEIPNDFLHCFWNVKAITPWWNRRKSKRCRKTHFRLWIKR